MTEEVKKRIENINNGIVPEGYKKVGKDIIPDDWEQRKCSELMSISSADRVYKEQWQDNGVPFFRSSDVMAVHRGTENEPAFISEDVFYELSAKSGAPKKNDVFLTGGGTVAMPYWVPNDEPLYFKDGDLVWLSNYEGVDGKYLYHYFLTPNFRKYVKSISHVGTIAHWTIEQTAATPIIFPCLEEQKRISEFFDNLDNTITLHQRKCDELKNLKKAYLIKMFPQKGQKRPEIRFSGFTDDWEQRKLGNLVKDHNAGVYISKEDYGEGINIIGVGNIYDNDIFNGELYRLAPVIDEKFLLQEGDLIYGESSLVPEGIARTVCVGKNGVGCAFAWHTRRVKLDKNIVNSHFATLELNYNTNVRKHLMSVSTQTALTGMTTEGYFSATLTLPNVEEQEKISEYFQNLDTLITLHQRKCELLKLKKKALLQLVMTGKVRFKV